ncbi:hypothetical protein Bcav_2869 [Beutenbergia cavernae DSM 12333]|uniref:Uncharacterized protein n=1 Tax=Beutenbergia cavernae (strain ATCC BAA-8 / DSM 12333 / CCUG 43141 / JCM 11478 / NBRC 16432 / NCIMB 13614 / HKI 0122) TaxID=471853 RepID=C5BYZ9_BEUC1|nr:hypothetical protein [Beutenbergia cavernae]ACQ81114.1 hypothetical protein Bcav_2869 [Beutenbergia cavernae DSM 12333]
MSLLRRLSRRAWEVIAVVAVVAFVAWVLRGSLLDVLLSALVTVGFIAVGHAVPFGEATEWPRLPATERSGRRAEVYQLSWSMTTRGNLVDDAAVRRLRAVAADRLDLLGLDLDEVDDDARIAATLGARAHAVLTRAEGGTSLAEVSVVLTALERLDPTTHPTRSPA